MFAIFHDSSLVVQISELYYFNFQGVWKYYDHEDTPPDGVSWQTPLNTTLLTQSPLYNKILQLLPTTKETV